MTDADLTLTAALDAIRERNERYITGQALTEWSVAQMPPGDVRRLLTALDAVLARHVPKTITIRHLCVAHGTGKGFAGLNVPEMRAAVDACPDCRKVGQTVCAACDPACPDDDAWPCEDYMAISRALLGEVGTAGD